MASLRTTNLEAGICKHRTQNFADKKLSITFPSLQTYAYLLIVLTPHFRYHHYDYRWTSIPAGRPVWHKNDGNRFDERNQAFTSMGWQRRWGIHRHHAIQNIFDHYKDPKTLGKQMGPQHSCLRSRSGLGHSLYYPYRCKNRKETLSQCTLHTDILQHSRRVCHEKYFKWQSRL